MPLFLEACPSSAEKWHEHRALNADEQLLYVDVGEFAHHLVELHKSNRTTEFRTIFDTIVVSGLLWKGGSAAPRDKLTNFD